MKLDEFTNCCGICILSGFGDTATATRIKTFEGIVASGLRHYSMLLVAINHHQNEQWSKILEKHKFILTSTTLNKNSGNVIYLYHLTPSPWDKDLTNQYFKRKR